MVRRIRLRMGLDLGLELGLEEGEEGEEVHRRVGRGQHTRHHGHAAEAVAGRLQPYKTRLQPHAIEAAAACHRMTTEAM